MWKPFPLKRKSSSGRRLFVCPPACAFRLMARLRWSCCGLRAHAPTSGAGATGTSPMLLRWRWTVASNELNPDIALWPVVVAGGGVMYSINQAFP